MAWPQALDYNEAVQCPAASFRDAELRQSRVRLNALGMPSPHSGNFADVYQMEGPGGQSWAVKCFTRKVHGLQGRYHAVSGHLRDRPLPFMVDFQFLEGGIRINGEWVPVVKMSWVEGLRLNQFVADHADDRAVLDRLAELWLRLAVQLSEAEVAHGDLQHGNVLLVPGAKANSLSLKLIDYDGIWIPALAEQPSGENGHPSFQHPQRQDDGYGPDMDRFSHLVIYTALRALALEGRSLWRRFDTAENLLFRDSDFREPAESDLFKRLWTDFGGDVRALAGWLVMASQGPLNEVPALDELVEGTAVKRLNSDEEDLVYRLLEIEPKLQVQARSGEAAAVNSGSSEKPREKPKPAAQRLPAPTPEQRRAAVGQFERANQVIATGNYDYGLKLLLSCCTLDRANLIYRQTLRRSEKAKYKDNLRGSWLSWLTTSPAKARLKAALRSGDYISVLDVGERVLLRNPWDIGTQMDMAHAAEELGLIDLAVWSLEQARQKDATDPNVNKALALIYEKRGNFTQAMALWNLVRKARPADAEAQSKLMELAAHDTIQRGNLEALTANPNRQNGEPGQKESPASQRSKTAISSTSPAASAGGMAGDPLRKRIHADPTDLHSYLQLAQFHRRADDLDAARAILQEGLGPTGNAFELIVEMTDLEIEPFRRDLAATEARLKSDPDNATLRGLRGQLTKEINTRELDLFRHKADRFPMDGTNRLEVGIRLLNVGQIDEAIRELQAVRNDPRLAGKAAFHLGRCFTARNNGRLAQRNLEEALQNLPPAETELRKEAMYCLAKSCADAGDVTRAIDLATDLAHEDFAYRDVSRLLEEWQARLQEKV